VIVKTLTSSSIELIDKISYDAEEKEVVLNESVIKGLFPQQRDDIKRNVALANQAWKTSGQAIRACAFTLNEIKENTPRGNWKALLESGDLDFSKSVAIDLVAAHNGMLANSSIPDRFLANISARTLGTVSRINDEALRQKVMERIVESEGKGFPESELKKMMRGNVKVNRSKAGKKALKELDANATKAETIDYYTKVVNTLQAQADSFADQLKKAVIANQDKAAKIGKLEEQIRQLKAG
tara:strand:- start:43 stop:762 length:720 start_codon:yes stop_codon:yes gene_type:complete